MFFLNRSCHLIMRRSVLQLSSLNKLTSFLTGHTIQLGQLNSCHILNNLSATLQISSLWTNKKHFNRYLHLNGYEDNIIQPSLDEKILLMKSRLARDHFINKTAFHKLLSELEFNRNVPQGTCYFLLHCCANYMPHVVGLHKIDLALKIWNTFRNMKEYSMTKQDIHGMLEVYAAGQQPLRNLHWLSSDISTYEDEDILLKMLHCAAESGDLEAITDLLSKIKTLGYPVDENIFACIVLGHGRARDYKGIKSVLETMKDGDVLPGSDTFVSILQSQLENNKPIAETLKQMKEQKITLNQSKAAKIVPSLAISKEDNQLSLLSSILPKDEFSHEMLKCAIQLVHSGNHRLAVKLLIQTPAAFGQLNQPNTFAAFLPREFVAADQEPEDIVDLCNTLQKSFPQHQSFILLATEASLRDQSKFEISNVLLGHITPVRPHYFWPLIITIKKTTDMVKILLRMQCLGLQLDYDTLAFYVFPTLVKSESTPINTIRTVQQHCKLSILTLLSPMVHTLLSAELLKEAVTLCRQYKSRSLEVHRLIKPLVTATLKTGDLECAVTMLTLLCTSKQSSLKSIDVVGAFLYEYIPKGSPEKLETILKIIQREGLKMSLASYELLHSKYSTNKTLLPLFNAITNTMMEGNCVSNSLPHPRDMTVEELEGHLIELKSKNLNTRGTLRRLLQAHCRLNNADRALQLKEELDDSGSILSPGILASLFGLFLNAKDYINANKVLQQITRDYPNFLVDEHKIIDFCCLKLLHGSDEDIKEVLQKYATHVSQNKYKIRGGKGILRNCVHLLSIISKTQGEEERFKMEECLKHLNFLH